MLLLAVGDVGRPGRAGLRDLIAGGLDALSPGNQDPMDRRESGEDPGQKQGENVGENAGENGDKSWGGLGQLADVRPRKSKEKCI